MIIVPTCPSGGTGIVNTITLASGAYPSAIAINPAGTRLYVINQGSKSISTIDTSNDSVLSTVTFGGTNGFSTGGWWPSLAVNRSGTKVYFQGAHDTYYGELGWMNTSTNALTYVGQYPAGRLATNPTKDTMWVTIGTSSGCYVLKTTDDSSLQQPTHYYPNSQPIRYNADGSGYCSSNANQVAWGWVNSDGSHQAIKQDYRIATNSSYSEVYMNAAGTKLWTTLEDKFWEIGLDSRTTNYVNPLTSFVFTTNFYENVTGMIVKPSEDKAILYKWGTDWNFKVIDIINKSVLATYTYGQGVASAVVAPDGTKAYLANYTDSTITVYRF